MTVTALYEGSYSVDITKRFIPFDPDIHDPKDRPASLFVQIQPFLVRTSRDIILLDTGLGYKLDNGRLHIHKNLEKEGIVPDDVTKVLMSHLHFDHAGGMLYEQDYEWKLSFPQAEYYIQRGEWENAFSKPSKSYKTEPLEFLQRTGQLVLLEGSTQINAEISSELTGAHTEFHQVFYIREGEQTFFFGGDVVPEAMQVLRRFIAKYDLDGRKSMELRQRFGQQAAEGGWICLMYHDKKNAMVQFGLEKESLVLKNRI